MERPVRPKGHGADAVLLGLRSVAVGDLLVPAGRLGGQDRVEQTGVEHLGEIDDAVVGVDQLGGGIQSSYQGFHGGQRGWGDQVGLVQQDHVRELHLVDQKV